MGPEQWYLRLTSGLYTGTPIYALAPMHTCGLPRTTHTCNLNKYKKPVCFLPPRFLSGFLSVLPCHSCWEHAQAEPLRLLLEGSWHSLTERLLGLAQSPELDNRASGPGWTGHCTGRGITLDRAWAYSVLTTQYPPRYSCAMSSLLLPAQRAIEAAVASGARIRLCLGLGQKIPSPQSL